MRDTRSHIKLCHVRRNFTGYTQPLHWAYMRAFKSSIRHEVAKHFAEFFLEAESNFEHVNLDSFRFSGSCCSRSCTQQHRTQTTCKTNCWLALHRLERGGAARVSHSSKNVFWRRENCFHEAQPRSLTRQMPRPKPPTVIQRRT